MSQSNLETATPATVLPSRFPGLLRFFEPAPTLPVTITEPKALDAAFRSWRVRVLASSIAGYAVFYFVRKNLATAIPVMEQDLHISKTVLGAYLSAHGVIYGISKFANGFLGDRCNARAMMIGGLLGSAILNVCFGVSNTVLALGSLWMFNGWFQGMGFPPCARLLTHWFPPKQMATKMSIWNTSHQIGAALIVVLCGYLVVTSWRLCFIVPAGIALACCGFLYFVLPDTPGSVGLPEVPGTETPPLGKHETYGEEMMKLVFRNKYIWLVSVANLFVYILRYSVFDWGTSYLVKARHIQITNASWMLFGFEISGLMGALLAGWMTDRFLKGRAVRICVVYMVLAGVSIALFWRVSGQSAYVSSALLCCCGFFIYGPQCLIAAVAANLATKRAAATAVGLTGLFGYGSTLFSGIGFGALVQHYGWDAGFGGLLGIAAAGTVLLLFAWRANAHGYQIESKV